MTLKIGVIGTGAIGQDHIRRLTNTLTGAEVVAVNDINLDETKAFVAREKLGAKVYDNGQELIRASDVDALVVTSWGPSHAEFVLGSIAAGKPVFCEKPLATTAKDARSIVDAEIRHGRKLVQVGFMRRYDAGYRMLKAALQAGTIGEALMVHCAHRNPSVPDSYTGDMALTDSFVHEIDVLRWLLDDDYVTAQVVNGRDTRRAEGGLRDPHFVLLETRKGIRIDVEIYVNCQYGYDIQCQVVGETGIANLPEPMSLLLRKDASLSHAILTDWKQRFIASYDVELQEWINSTRDGEVHGPTSWDGYFASVTADACVEAKRTRAIVPISIDDTPAFYARR
ncbi:Inositol 2-dehydrogenase [uncultured Pleomorphomonas sp.]|uniref:Inositol 2-dehydrogenase n=1 Tax=uncultured Pleomorphomonas sp. TaxID=442121 RepID=A0A212LHD0_9HYPH|nr:Gfo/Idh/MocA family oxidoreductase [uncultured Pleomorphomonas sp.]SCM76877.1 Inositol 2-dehydrogenase [uncultured Pleomorphomonas sp.]